MQSWCRTCPPNGSKRIRAKQKLLRKQKRAHKSSWSRQGNQRSFTLTNPQNSVKLVKIYPWIIVRQHHSETNGIAERAVRRIKERTSTVLLQSGLDEKWWADFMEYYCYLRNMQNLLCDGKHLTNGDSATIQRINNYWSNITLFLPRTCRECIWGFGQDGHTWNPCQETQCKNLWVRTASENIHLNPGQHGPRRRTRKSSRRIKRVSEGSLPPLWDSSSDDGEARNDFWSVSGNYIYRHHVQPKVKLYVRREESFPIPLRYIDVTRATSTT